MNKQAEVQQTKLIVRFYDMEYYNSSYRADLKNDTHEKIYHTLFHALSAIHKAECIGSYQCRMMYSDSGIIIREADFLDN